MIEKLYNDILRYEEILMNDEDMLKKVMVSPKESHDNLLIVKEMSSDYEEVPIPVLRVYLIRNMSYFDCVTIGDYYNEKQKEKYIKDFLRMYF